jgi:transcriptional regulator with PAS, ATPase and Fis domain
MKRVCAWCDKEMGSVKSEFNQPSDNVITHGICDDCKSNIRFQKGTDLQSFLDSFKSPILVVDTEGVVKTANKKAQSVLGKGGAEFEGYRFGDVFECANARLPGGCGHTIHCSGCTIRRTVMETRSTGKAFFRVPAYLNKRTTEALESDTICFLISTKKVGDMVLLSIDDVGVGKKAQSSATADIRDAAQLAVDG